MSYKRRDIGLTLSFVAAALVGLMTIGCASDGPAAKPAVNSGEAFELPKFGPASLSTIKRELLDAKARLHTTMEALRVLQKSSTEDAPTNYARFMHEYDTLKAKSDAVAARSVDLKERAANYHAMWDREVGSADPEFRRQATEREADAARIYGTINTELELTRNSFRPLMANLKELGSNLRGNPVPANLNSISGEVAKVEAQAGEVDTHAGAIITAIDEITTATGETIAPVTVDPAS